jgi:hypothetical protein
VFENRVLRRIFGPRKDEVTGGWRKLHNEELDNLYSSPDIIIMIRLDGSDDGLLGCDIVWTCRRIISFRRLYPPCIIQQISHRTHLDAEGGCSVCLRNIGVQPREYRRHNLKDHNLTCFTSSYIIVYCNVLHELCFVHNSLQVAYVQYLVVHSVTWLYVSTFWRSSSRYTCIYFNQSAVIHVLYIQWVYSICECMHIFPYFVFLSFSFLRSRWKK